MKDNDIRAVNEIKILAIDMINNAKSGHPGVVLSAAPILYTLFTRHLKVIPSDPNYINRDRFVLSAGHASALLYATMHVCGYPISINDLINFTNTVLAWFSPDTFSGDMIKTNIS